MAGVQLSDEKQCYSCWQWKGVYLPRVPNVKPKGDVMFLITLVVFGMGELCPIDTNALTTLKKHC